MSLREDMWKYEQITGESAEHVPIIKLGAFLDGYDMGIKALEQQSSEDYISREAVDNYIVKLMSGYLYDEERARLEDLTAYIWELPSITPQQTKWISVSERLPEENISVIGTTKYDDIYETELYDDCGEKKWYADGCYDVPIVAWLPLPEPYRESEGVCKDCYYNDGEVHAECVICDKTERGE